MILNILNTAFKVVFGIIAFPFLAFGFLVTKLLGGDPFSLDGMGIGFLITAGIAIAAFVATVSFGIGTLI